MTRLEISDICYQNSRLLGYPFFLAYVCLSDNSLSPTPNQHAFYKSRKENLSFNISVNLKYFDFFKTKQTQTILSVPLGLSTHIAVVSTVILIQEMAKNLKTSPMGLYQIWLSSPFGMPRIKDGPKGLWGRSLLIR